MSCVGSPCCCGKHPQLGTSIWEVQGQVKWPCITFVHLATWSKSLQRAKHHFKCGEGGGDRTCWLEGLEHRHTRKPNSFFILSISGVKPEKWVLQYWYTVHFSPRFADSDLQQFTWGGELSQRWALGAVKHQSYFKFGGNLNDTEGPLIYQSIGNCP